MRQPLFHASGINVRHRPSQGLALQISPLVASPGERWLCAKIVGPQRVGVRPSTIRLLAARSSRSTMPPKLPGSSHPVARVKRHWVA
jgi:hypothetical protein